MNKNARTVEKPQTPFATAPAPTPFTGGWLDGTLVLFEPTRELLFVRSNETKRKVAIHWEPDTQFVMDGQPVSSAELKLGQRMHLHCRMSGHELSADHVSLEAPATKLAAASRPPGSCLGSEIAGRKKGLHGQFQS